MKRNKLIQKKPMQVKKCDVCHKNPVWKIKTVNGERLKLCQQCLAKAEKKQLAEKKEKVKLKNKIKRERVTEKKLDTIFSRLVRNIYPPVCHSSGVSITVETSHCAHLVSRRYRCVRWDLRNCYPTTPSENLHNQIHVIYLARKMKEYYGIEIEYWDQLTKTSVCRLTEGQRKYLYDVFKEALDQVYSILLTSEPYEKLAKLRLEIIEKTKLIG